jgi:hypothetical protein
VLNVLRTPLLSTNFKECALITDRQTTRGVALTRLAIPPEKDGRSDTLSLTSGAFDSTKGEGLGCLVVILRRLEAGLQKALSGGEVGEGQAGTA